MRSKIPRSRRRSFLVVVGLCLVAVGAGKAHGKAPSLEFTPGLDLPFALEANVRFWIEVFTAYSQRQAIVHDRENSSVVLAVVPLKSGASEELDGVLARYRSLVLQLAGAAQHDQVSLLTPFRPPLDPRWIAAAKDRVRVQQGQREAFAEGLLRSQAYLSRLRHMLREASLPVELAYLPHVESSFNAEAISQDGALGLWQLMPETARQYLRVDGLVDERRHPYKATAAAAQYLQEAFDALGSWPLAITAYNYGIGGTRRAVAAVGSTELSELIERHESPAFGFACKNFYAQFLAAVHVAEHQRYYFPELKMPPQWEYVVRKGDSLWKIARDHGTSVAKIRSANNLARDTTPLQLGQRLVIVG